MEESDGTTRRDAGIAWAWGMNGLFTTIGGILSGLIAIFYGFKVTLAVAIFIYVLAALAFHRLARLSDQSAPLAIQKPVFSTASSVSTP